MPVLYLVEFEGDPASLLEAYDRVNAGLAEAAGPETAAPGLMHHVCVTTEHGIRLFDLWESTASADRFYGSELLRQQFASAGVPPLVPGQIAAYPVHEHFPRS